MKIKKNLKISTTDFFYDLAHGGYLNPLEICEDEQDARRVEDAVAVLLEFEQSCEDQIPDFSR